MVGQVAAGERRVRRRRERRIRDRARRRSAFPDSAAPAGRLARQSRSGSRAHGGDRYFGYGHRVYDAAEGLWHGPSGSETADLEGPFWWGASHRERWFHSYVYWGEGWSEWLLLPPKIEYPPFAEEIAFRVARTGRCLRLREDPGEDGRVLGCLPDGERLLFAERDAEVERDWADNPLSPHSSIALLERDQVWVHVRTADGSEGWVSHDYLDHD